jgi:hypothetical protein
VKCGHLSCTENAALQVLSDLGSLFITEQAELIFAQELIRRTIPSVEFFDQCAFHSPVSRQLRRAVLTTGKMLLHGWPYLLPRKISKQFFATNGTRFTTLHDYFL